MKKPRILQYGLKKERQIITYPVQPPHTGSRSGNKLQKIVTVYLLKKEHNVPPVFLQICTLPSVHSFTFSGCSVGKEGPGDMSSQDFST